MNQNQLHDLLDGFASTEIPDTMNLLKDIEARIQATPVIPTRPLLRLSRTAAVLVALMFATVAYAVYQFRTESGGDTGIVTVGTQELITELGLIQTHPNADVNINIPWAYADGNRIAFGWNVDYALTYALPYVQSIEVLDAEGNPFSSVPFLIGGGGGGGGGGGNETRAGYGSFITRNTTNIAGNPETLEITVVISISDTPSDYSFGLLGGGSGGGSGGSSGGGGGGGGSSDTAAPELLPVPLYEARFTFTVPFIPAVEASVENYTATNQGIDISLRNIRYAPSVTLAELCLPVQGFNTYKVVLASPENTQILLETSDASGTQLSEDGLTECRAVTIMGILADETGALNITIERLVSLITDWDLSDDSFNTFVEAVQAEGFKAEVVVEKNADGGFNINIMNNLETGEDAMQIYNRVNELAEEYMAEIVSGPWDFAIALK